eukprot:gene1531-1621_t
MSKQTVGAKILNWNETFEEKKSQQNLKKKGNRQKIEFTADGRIVNTLLGTDEQVQYFLERAFQRHPIVRSGNSVREILKLFHDLDILSLLKETASDAIHVWLKQLNSEALTSFTVDDPEQAYKLYQAGHSLYCRAPKEVEELLVSRLSNELHYGLKNINNNDRYRRGEIELFFSRKGHLTKFHTDFQENFTIQLQGKKKWTFKSSTAFAPIRGCTLHFNDVEKDSSLIEQQLKIAKVGDIHFNGSQVLAKNNKDCSTNHKNNDDKQPKKKQKLSKVETKPTEQENRGTNEENEEYTVVILDEGDIMYHPAGIWHQVECIEDSISMNISLTSVSYADIFCNHLQQLLLENPLFRSSIFRPENDVKHYPEATSIMNSIIETTPLLLKSIRGEDILPFPTLNLLPVGKEENEDIDEDDEEEEEGIEEKSNGKRKRSDNHVEEVEGADDDNSNQSEMEEESDEDEIEIIEEEEDSDPLAKDNIIIETVNIEDFLKSNKKKSAKERFSSLSFRLNPFAVLLTERDLWRTSSAVLQTNSTVEEHSDYKFIIHSGYGNETLESVNRKVILLSSYPSDVDEGEQIILDQLVLAMNKLQKVYYEFRDNRQKALSELPDNKMLEKVCSSVPHINLQFFSELINKYPKRKELIEDKIIQLMIGLYYGGFFSSFSREK